MVALDSPCNKLVHPPGCASRIVMRSDMLAIAEELADELTPLLLLRTLGQ